MDAQTPPPRHRADSLPPLPPPLVTAGSPILPYTLVAIVGMLAGFIAGYVIAHG